MGRIDADLLGGAGGGVDVLEEVADVADPQRGAVEGKCTVDTDADVDRVGDRHRRRIDTHRGDCAARPDGVITDGERTRSIETVDATVHWSALRDRRARWLRRVS